MNEKPEALRPTEPEALRVADGLEGKHATGYQPYAVAELRRLHAENERLRQIVEDFPPVEAELREVSDRAHRLEQQRDALREELALAERLASGRLAMVEQLTEEVEALRRDAERYRWLLHWLVKTGLLSWERCRIDTPESYGDWMILRKPKVIDGSSLISHGETADAAIDAATKGDKT